MNELFAAIGRMIQQTVFWVVVQPWELCILVRAGRWIIKRKPGIHLRIPVLDAVYKQTSRLRTACCPTQTLSTSDKETVVIGATLAYSISDIEKLYQRLHHAEDTVVQLVACAIAREVVKVTKDELTPGALNEAVSAAVIPAFTEYGLGEIEVRITDFAFIRAFRIINDGRWSYGDTINTTMAAN